MYAYLYDTKKPLDAIAMQNLKTTSLKIDNQQLFILDQQALPQKQNWLLVSDVPTMVDHIHTLRVRGAPLIGLSASLLLALLAQQGMQPTQLLDALEILRAARPTAVNLMNNLDRMKKYLNQPDELVAEALNLIKEDQQLCENIAQAGVELLKPNSKILTHCNTGGLATAGHGTALGIIALAHEKGLIQSVWVDETRPLLQGGRLTTWELQQLDIPHHLICDSMAASLMAQGEIDAILVGADRIAANGDVANKIGTYSLAVLAKYHNVPFYVAAPHTTVDSACPNGDAIPIEQRSPQEVLGVTGSFGQVQWAPENTPVYNPAFDVTPAHFVTAWILDTGVVIPDQVQAGYFK